MKPGETPFESAGRILKRELGFVLPEEAKKHVREGGRFTGVGAYSYTWEMREQDPKTNGCADISVVMAIEVTKKEIDSFKFDSQEYEQHAWVEPQQIIQDGTKHPALRRSVADYVRGREWEEIAKESTKTESEDAAFGRKMKNLISQWMATDDILLAATDAAHKRQRMSS